MWTWNLFNLIFLIFRIVWFVPMPIKLEFIYKLTSVILSKDQGTHWDIYIQIDATRNLAPFSKLSHESDIIVQNSLDCNNSKEKI